MTHNQQQSEFIDDSQAQLNNKQDSEQNKKVPHILRYTANIEYTFLVNLLQSFSQYTLTYFSNGILKNDKRYNPTKIISVLKLC